MSSRWLPIAKILAAVRDNVPNLSVAKPDKTSLTRRTNDVEHVLSVFPAKHDNARLQWSVAAHLVSFPQNFAIAILPPELDAVQDARMSLSMAADVETWESGYRRPAKGEGISLTFIADIRHWGDSLVSFVSSQQDFGMLLLADSDVHRNGVRAEFRSSNSPARLVQSVIVARQIRDFDLEHTALQKLQRMANHKIDGFLPTYGKAVQYWAKEYRSKVQVDIGDLVKGDFANLP
ncbi:hypothetical protein ABGA98_05085 [Nonomuraea sp. B1E8]|uniref:hypothetical protein n=1 Tax=Nonomuraea sp. B1E8 TaxID=3153575 RepID=UPI00325D2AD3